MKSSIFLIFYAIFAVHSIPIVINKNKGLKPMNNTEPVGSVPLKITETVQEHISNQDKKISEELPTTKPTLFISNTNKKTSYDTNSPIIGYARVVTDPYGYRPEDIGKQVYSQYIYSPRDINTDIYKAQDKKSTDSEDIYHITLIQDETNPFSSYQDSYKAVGYKSDPYDYNNFNSNSDNFNGYKSTGTTEHSYTNYNTNGQSLNRYSSNNQASYNPDIQMSDSYNSDDFRKKSYNSNGYMVGSNIPKRYEIDSYIPISNENNYHLRGNQYMLNPHTINDQLSHSTQNKNYGTKRDAITHLNDNIRSFLGLLVTPNAGHAVKEILSPYLG